MNKISALLVAGIIGICTAPAFAAAPEAAPAQPTVKTETKAPVANKKVKKAKHGIKKTAKAKEKAAK